MHFMREMKKYFSVMQLLVNSGVLLSPPSLCHHSGCYCCLLNSSAQQGLFATTCHLRASWALAQSSLGLTGESLGPAAINKYCTEGSKGTRACRLMDSLQKTGKRTLFMLASQSMRTCRTRSRQGPSVAAEHSPRGSLCWGTALLRTPLAPLPHECLLAMVCQNTELPSYQWLHYYFHHYWWIIILNCFWYETWYLSKFPLRVDSLLQLYG